MAKNILYIVFLVLFMFSCASRSKEVLDKESAVKIAKIALRKTLTEEDIKEYEPFESVLIDTNQKWIVFPADISEYGGTPPVVSINKIDGKVLHIKWGEGAIPLLNFDHSQLEKTIVGRWTMCERGYNDVDTSHVITSNVCTYFGFFEDGNGFVKFPEGKLSFKWIHSGNKINFTFASEQDKKRFISTNTEFTVSLTRDEKFERLKLIDESSNKWYLLLRSN